MPVYEYRCAECGRRATKLFRSMSDVRPIPCPHCGADALERLISKPAILKGSKGGESGSGDYGDLDDGGPGEDDPRAVARMARSMAREMGEELPAGYDELLGRMEAGDMPDDDEFAAIDEDASDDDSDLD